MLLEQNGPLSNQVIMIDGFIGHSDGSLTTGVVVMLGANLVMGFVGYRLFKTGDKLKA